MEFMVGVEKIISDNDFHKVPIGVYFVILGQITPPLTVTVGHVVTERK
jgi:hypothetical protein